MIKLISSNLFPIAIVVVIHVVINLLWLSPTKATAFRNAFSFSFALDFPCAFLRLQSFWPNAQKNGYINHFQSTAATATTATITTIA